jgi:hypothetical protein
MNLETTRLSGRPRMGEDGGIVDGEGWQEEVLVYTVTARNGRDS